MLAADDVNNSLDNDLSICQAPPIFRQDEGISTVLATLSFISVPVIQLGVPFDFWFHNEG